MADVLYVYLKLQNYLELLYNFADKRAT
jgi:hypothetical protein